MTKKDHEFISIVKDIVSEAKDLKDEHTKEKNARVNYACIFCQDQIEWKEFLEKAKQIGKIIQETPTGPVFQIPPLDTVAGKLQLLKIRKPDPTRPKRGDADFTVSDYQRFKKKHLGKTGFSLIKKEKFEMIELVDKKYGVRCYFSHPTLGEVLGLGKGK